MYYGDASKKLSIQEIYAMFIVLFNISIAQILVGYLVVFSHFWAIFLSSLLLLSLTGCSVDFMEKKKMIVATI